MTLSPLAASDARLIRARTFVQGIAVEAEIGLYEHEYGRTQPLLVSVELKVDAAGYDQLGDIINYEHIVTWTRDVAASGHIELVETFAGRVALACLRDPRVISATVRVEKPQALAPALAGVEITLSRT